MHGNLGKGLRYEDQARIWLEGRGLRLLQANYRCRFGEIDLIMQDDETLCFVEVKYRASAAFGGAAAALPQAKRRKLTLSAECFLAAHPALADSPMRFDALLIQRESGSDNRIEWLRDAFAADD